MIFGLFAFVLYLYFFVGFNNLATVIRGVNLTEFFVFYSLGIGTMLLVMLCWVISWRSLLKALSVKIGLRKAFLYYWVGDFVDLVVPCPGVCGDATRLYLVHKETRDSYGAIAAAGVTNRIVAYSVVTAGLSTGIIYLLVNPTEFPVFATGLLFLAWLGALAWLTVLLCLALSKRALKKFASILVKVLKTLRIHRYSEGLSPKTLESLSIFNEGFKFFRKNPRYLIKPLIFQFLSFTLNLVVYILVFNSLGSLGFGFLPINFFIVVYFLAGAVQDASASFSVGALEIILTTIFVFYGIAPAESGVAAVVLRTVTFWFPLIVGYVIVQVVGARRLLSARARQAIEAEEEIEKEQSLVPTTENELR